MKKTILSIILITTVITGVFAQSVNDILKKIDNNTVWDSIKYSGELEIHISGKKYEKSFEGVSKGKDNFFIEFTNQADMGTKYLKKDGDLFVYTLDTEEVMPITGHMLKESMMGSDLSYEDMTDNGSLIELYNGKIIEETTHNDKEVWVLELNAKKKTVSYPKKVIYVRKDNFVPIKEEWYSLSGHVLKEVETKNIQIINGKFFPTETITRDTLRKDSKTIFKMTDIEMGISIPARTFSIRNLER